MRGTPEVTAGNSRTNGIIPAYAGNTLSTQAKCSTRRDHPRVCGEHRGWLRRHRQRWGSSPRMRGTLVGELDPALFNGIIPAYAGNTLLVWWSRRVTRDHPRVCGEHIASNKLYSRPSGSSPRMRGTRHDQDSRPRQTGIIPAYAGNTVTMYALESSKMDHPRVCGEHS